MVDQYLTFATQEKLKAGVTPKEAIAILRPDLKHLIATYTHVLSVLHKQLAV